jgi:hypothetical protein
MIAHMAFPGCVKTQAHCDAVDWRMDLFDYLILSILEPEVPHALRKTIQYVPASD